jgi:hypothetical protein
VTIGNENYRSREDFDKGGFLFTVTGKKWIIY